MDKKIDFKFTKPFGPMIAKVNMPIEIIDKLNIYIDEIIIDKNKMQKLNYGSKLAGNVQQEFKLEKDFIQSSGWGNFLTSCSNIWLQKAINKKITKFELISTWIVRQFKNDYNPIHTHGGHLSGVGYLKVPKTMGEYSQKNKVNNKNGLLSLIHGSKMFLSDSTFNIEPCVGDFYFFPNYLMHTVYPFSNTDEERRSISFNAKIDEDIYNVYS
ncbi:2OG-Fe(II) oxygenase family protein [Candidatus Pelagibacter sp.]|nr:2OG-Fe(II) oxygenase family protein [Candidatus Pelagibacter sp.]